MNFLFLALDEFAGVEQRQSSEALATGRKLPVVDL
jgi:hypothetical protein